MDGGVVNSNLIMCLLEEALASPSGPERNRKLQQPLAQLKDALTLPDRTSPKSRQLAESLMTKLGSGGLRSLVTAFDCWLADQNSPSASGKSQAQCDKPS